MDILLLIKNYLLSQIITVVLFIVGCWLLFGFYVMAMNLERLYKERKAAGDDLSLAQKMFAYPWIGIMVVVDILFHVIIGTLMFCDIPRELTLSQRLNRYTSKNKGSWRYNLAKWMAVQLLNPFSIGYRHIKLPLE